MATLVIRHAVADYAGWRVVYDEAEPLRARHGCTDARVLKDAADPSTLLVLHEFPSVEAVHDFADDPELKATMQRAGVAGPPRIEIYDRVD